MGAISSSSSFEECVSNLLCAEDASNVVGISSDDENENENENENDNDNTNISNGDNGYQKWLFLPSCSSASASSNCFTAPDEEQISAMVERESDFMVLKSYRMDLAVARESAVGWILKVHGCYSFGLLTAYLSINYLDRFLSRYQLPEGKAWMLQLLSVACLSLAAKMEETEVPLLLDLQTEAPKFIFEARTVKRMELLVLSTLQWRMLSITPFSFLDYFFNKGGGNSDKPPPRAMAARAAELILSTTKGIQFLDYRPSAVAAAAVISAAEEFLRPETAAQYRNSVLSCSIVSKDSILKCHSRIQQLIVKRFSKPMPSVSSSPLIPQSPVGVLDACNNTITNSTTSSSFEQSLKSVNLYASVAAKRRKLDVYCNP